MWTPLNKSKEISFKYDLKECVTHKKLYQTSRQNPQGKVHKTDQVKRYQTKE